MNNQTFAAQPNSRQGSKISSGSVESGILAPLRLAIQRSGRLYRRMILVGIAIVFLSGVAGYISARIEASQQATATPQLMRGFTSSSKSGASHPGKVERNFGVFLV